MEKKAAEQKENEMKERKVELNYSQNDILCESRFPETKISGAREGQQETAEGEGVHACGG